MKYPKTTLFVVAAVGLLVTTAAQPNATWHMLREGYGLHYTSPGRRAAAEAEIARVRPLLQAALETCDLTSAARWSRRSSVAQGYLRSTGIETAESWAMGLRYAECLKAKKYWWKTDSLTSPVSSPDTGA